MSTATAAPIAPPAQVELLAPAGDWDAMRAAVANGADAVYFGLRDFNARHRAANFSLDELPALMEYLHAHNVKGYLTFNTLIFADELEAAADYIRALAGTPPSPQSPTPIAHSPHTIDGVLVQDLGLVQLLHRMAPSIDIHSSTQMTLTESRGIEFVRKLGVKRIVLARELSVTEIRKIKQDTDIDLEVFIHGALCVSYSGQCLTSESLGGRSANRGQCAQACRLPYQLLVDGQPQELGDVAYLLSPQDLAAYDLIGELVKIGVTSFKIEGRLKSAHYVAATTQTYRAALDSALQGSHFKIKPEARQDLEQSFSRGFTPGFLTGTNHQQLVSGRFPKTRGVRVGTVSAKRGQSLIITLDPTMTLKPGDGVVFDQGHPDQDEQGGRVFYVRPGKTPNTIEIDLGQGDVNLAAVELQAIVWRTDDPAMRRRLEQSFSRDLVPRRAKVDVTIDAIVGQNLRLTMLDRYGHQVQVESDKPLEKATKFPLTEAVVREQLARLGETPFELARLKLNARGGPMGPKSVLNDLRRQACAKLILLRESRLALADNNALETMRNEIRLSPATPRAGADVLPNGDVPQLSILVRTPEQLDAVLSWQPEADAPTSPFNMIYLDYQDIRQYKSAVEKCHAANAKVALATLRVIKPGEQGLLEQIARANPDAVLVRNLAAVSFYSEMFPHLPQIGDYALNIANDLAASIFRHAGLLRMVPSYDLNWKQLAALLSRIDPAIFECVIHQHMPMFHMEHCVFAHLLSSGKDYHNCGRPCEKHQIELSDRMNQDHPVIADVGCRNTVFNSQAQTAAEYVADMKQLGVRHFRVELLRENADEALALIQRYARVIAGAETGIQAVRSLRVLNQLGVTRGTLARD